MTWTAPEVTRGATPPPQSVILGDERVLADFWLDYHRQTLLWQHRALTIIGSPQA